MNRDQKKDKIGEIALVSSLLIKSLWSEYDQEICALKTKIAQIKESQSFLSEKYDCLNEDYNKLKKIYAEQKAEITALKSESSDLKKTSIKEIEKIDNLEQYGRRQNLEIAGVPVQDGEDTNAVVMEVAKLVDVDILPNHISTSHRLPKKISQNGNVTCTPPIIVRFTNRDIRNEIYANCKKTRTLDLKNFSVNETKKFLSMKISRNPVNGYFGRLSNERKVKIGSIIGRTTAAYLQRRTMTLMQF